MDASVFQTLSSGSSHAEHGEEAARCAGYESEDGMEEAMDYFL